jgi:hypothetical protein
VAWKDSPRSEGVKPFKEHSESGSTQIAFAMIGEPTQLLDVDGYLAWCRDA